MTGRRSKQLPWDEYWRLVLRLSSNSGFIASIPEPEMRGLYDTKRSPLEASEYLARKYRENNVMKERK